MTDEREAPVLNTNFSQRHSDSSPTFETLEVDNETSDDARRFALLTLEKRDGFCSQSWNGKLYILENGHSSRKIGVMIETTWTYNGRPRRETKSYSLLPGQVYEGLGCDIPGPTSQRFTRRVKTAWFE